MMAVHTMWGPLLLLAVGGLLLLGIVAGVIALVVGRRTPESPPQPPTPVPHPVADGAAHAAERLRILGMVRDGRVSPEEAERLLGAVGSVAAGSVAARCPYCAETIAPAATACPHCGSALGGPRGGAAGGGAASAAGGPLRGAALVLALYAACVGVIEVLRVAVGPFVGWHVLRSPAALLGGLMGATAVCGALLMFRRRWLGWLLVTLWSAAQIVEFVVNGLPVNRQLLHIGVVRTTNGNGLGFNLVGIALVLLAVAAGTAFRQRGGEQRS